MVVAQVKSFHFQNYNLLLSLSNKIPLAPSDEVHSSVRLSTSGDFLVFSAELQQLPDRGDRILVGHRVRSILRHLSSTLYVQVRTH